MDAIALAGGLSRMNAERDDLLLYIALETNSPTLRGGRGGSKSGTIHEDRCAASKPGSVRVASFGTCSVAAIPAGAGAGAAAACAGAGKGNEPIWTGLLSVVCGLTSPFCGAGFVSRRAAG